MVARLRYLARSVPLMVCAASMASAERPTAKMPIANTTSIMENPLSREFRLVIDNRYVSIVGHRQSCSPALIRDDKIQSPHRRRHRPIGFELKGGVLIQRDRASRKRHGSTHVGIGGRTRGKVLNLVGLVRLAEDHLVRIPFHQCLVPRGLDRPDRARGSSLEAIGVES